MRKNKIKKNKDSKKVGFFKKIIKKDKRFWIMLFIEIIFISSLIGFAFNMSYDTSSSDNSKTDVKIVSDKVGNYYYVQNVNGKIFSYLKDYRETPDLILRGYANKILESQIINISFSQNLSSSFYILKRALDVKNIPYNVVFNNTCTKGKIVLSEEKLEGPCINIYGSKDENYLKTDQLVYYILNN